MDERELDELLARLGITREQLDAIAEAGVFDEANSLYGEEAARADAMRNAPAPGMRQVGRVAVAAHPLEMLATGLQRAKGAKDYNAAMSERRALIDALRGGNRAAGVVGARSMLSSSQPTRATAPPEPRSSGPGPWADRYGEEDPGSVLARILRQIESEGR